MDRGKEDFLLNLAILKKVVEEDGETKVKELEFLSKLIANELAQILGKMF